MSSSSDREDLGLRWLNEPPACSVAADSIWVRTGDKTDFWRETFYGFVRDDGHFLHRDVTGDFTATVTVRGRYEELYDQAGLMVRIDERAWIKTGIEYTDGAQHFSVVVTRDQSDWSVVRLEGDPAAIDIRLTRHGDAIRIQYRVGAEAWRMARLAYLPPRDPIQVGVMACSPQRAGFEVTFEGFAITEPIARELHD